MLDDLEKIKNIDKAGMLDTIEKLPEQIKESEGIVNATQIPSLFKIDYIIVNGMGASGISGDIIQNLFRDKLDIPIFVTRDYDLPKWVNKNTLVFSQSYSGNTEETLSTFKHACQKKCKIIGISSGGKLQEYCEKREIPHIKLPAGYQPRAAVAYTLFSSIYVLKKIGLLDNFIDTEISETIEITQNLRDKNKKIVLTGDNFSKQIAKKIFNNIPQVYGWGVYTPIARRWCQQLSENSKIICSYDEVSECNHNDIVGWSMNPEVSKKFSCVLFRDSADESIYMSKRLNFMKEFYQTVAENVIEIQVEGNKRLAKMMYAMYLGDYVSCYLAILRETDPTPVEAITELKNDLAKI